MATGVLWNHAKILPIMLLNSIWFVVFFSMISFPNRQNLVRHVYTFCKWINLFNLCNRNAHRKPSVICWICFRSYFFNWKMCKRWFVYTELKVLNYYYYYTGGSNFQTVSRLLASVCNSVVIFCVHKFFTSFRTSNHKVQDLTKKFQSRLRPPQTSMDLKKSP